MKKQKLVALLAAVLLAMTILPAAAQETALTRIQKFPGIDYQISYPDGWHPKASETAVSISQKQADFELALGSNFAREGIEINFSVQPVEQTHPSLNNFADAVQGLFECDCNTTETELFDARALQFRATDDVGNTILMTIGIIDGKRFILGVAAPTESALDDFMPTWKSMRDSIEPHVMRRYEVANAGFSVAYPEAWAVESTGSSVIFAESQADIDAVVNSGRVDAANNNIITLEHGLRTDLARYGLPLDATLEDFVTFNARYFGITEDDLDAAPLPVMVFGEPAIEIQFTNSSSAKIAVMGYINNEAYVLVLTSPSREARDAFVPSWRSLLESTYTSAEAQQF